MLRVVTQPTSEPITLVEAKAHLRVDFEEDDPYIQGLISAARYYAETFQNRTLAPTTFEYILDCFPRRQLGYSNGSDYIGGSKPIRLPRMPLIALESVRYTTMDGVTYDLDLTKYVVKADGDILPSWGKYWPIDILTTGDAIKVRFTAGYTKEDVPPTTKQGILLLVGHWYENRETVYMGAKVPASIPFGADSLLWMDRSW